MAVAHDAVSESHTGTTGSVSEASFQWTHTPSGTPRGVLVFTFCNAGGGVAPVDDDATAVTYGGVALTAVPSGRAQDTNGERGDCKAWFVGSSIPTGAQTVLVTRNNNAIEMYALAITVTAGADTQVTGTTLLQESQSLVEQNVDDGSPGSDSVRYAGTFAGSSLVPNPGANSTALLGIALASVGTTACAAVRETTAGQGSRAVGFSAGADDVAAVHVAIREDLSLPALRLTRFY